MQNPSPNPRGRLLVFWIIWFSILGGVLLFQITLGKGVPLGANAPGAKLPPIVFVAIVQIAVASFIRWILIPRTQKIGQLLVLMIIGLALSESAEFFGLFLVPPDQPQTKLTLWILSILSVLQFVPLYANRAIDAASTASTASFRS